MEPLGLYKSSISVCRLMLIDAHALMFRFHHALGKAVEGKPAMPSTYGVMKTMLDMLEVSPPPSHLAIVMDSPGKTFRSSERSQNSDPHC